MEREDSFRFKIGDFVYVRPHGQKGKVLQRVIIKGDNSNVGRHYLIMYLIGEYGFVAEWRLSKH